MPQQDTELRRRVAGLIRDWCEREERSQEYLARRAGLGHRTVSAIVTGDRSALSAESVTRIGRAVGLSPTALGRLLYECVAEPAAT